MVSLQVHEQAEQLDWVSNWTLNLNDATHTYSICLSDAVVCGKVSRTAILWVGT